MVNIWNDSPFGFFLSHDVDAVNKYRSTFLSLLKIILKPNKFKLCELFQSKKDLFNDPYFKGFNYLLETSIKYNFKSTFYFITTPRNKLDDFYNFSSSSIKNIMTKLEDSKFEIGLHGSLDSYNNQIKLAEEAKKISNAPLGLRQHYLKYNIHSSIEAHENSDILYDASLAFPDIIGFRRGTCLPYKTFNFSKNRAANYLTIPFSVMDVTLKNYMKLSPQESFNLVKDQIQHIMKHNGVFGLLWHPGNCSDEWTYWLEEFYNKILSYIKDLNAQSMTGIEISRLINE